MQAMRTMRATFRTRMLAICSAVITSLAAWPSQAHAASGTPVLPDEAFLVRQPAFTDCELATFIALNSSRNAMAYNTPRDRALQPTEPPLMASTIEIIESVYTRMQQEKLRDYYQFTAEYFLQCLARKQLPVSRAPDVTKACVARQDIVFLLGVYRSQGLTQPDATAKVQSTLTPRSATVFPPSLIALYADMVYRGTPGGDDFELRRLTFETCLFQDEWQAWWKNEQLRAAQEAGR